MPVTTPKIDINLENVVTLLKGLPEGVVPSLGQRQMAFSLVKREAVRFWHTHTLIGYDVTAAGDEMFFWRMRPLDIDDTIACTLLTMLGITPGPEHFSIEPEEIWPEMKAAVLESIGAERHTTEMAVREQLAAEDYRQNGDYS